MRENPGAAGGTVREISHPGDAHLGAFALRMRIVIKEHKLS
jgi:hypothetical protein